LPSYAVAIHKPGKHKNGFAAEIAKAFRNLPVPVIGRVAAGEFVMDLRCLEDEEHFNAQLSHLRLGQQA
jgi:L-seryl-tRNA(Ser) seleniumtransferase